MALNDGNDKKATLTSILAAQINELATKGDLHLFACIILP
jgi:hypothetical protein